VAAGFSDGFFELGLQPWDMAAGALLITEAGGLVGNFTGEADFLQHRECLAGNARIYAQMVAVLQKYSKFAGVQDKAAAVQAVAELQAQAGTDPVAPL
jgi:myo-inositol-1(or 4)-monophosphatase